jgi:hypothetical protein
MTPQPFHHAAARISEDQQHRQSKIDNEASLACRIE